MVHLPPAYRGAPYHQPRPPSRRQRALRVFVRAVIAALIVLLIILVGAAVTHGAVPLFPHFSG
jgi:hypothetical protein